MVRALRAFAVFLALSPASAAPLPASSDIDRAFARLYNFDFAGAHAVLDAHKAADVGDPLTEAVRSAAYLYAELDRLQVLAIDFFLDDANLVDDRKRAPDPRIRERLFASVEASRRLAEARLKRDASDREALFAMCMTASVVADYTGLVEKRQWRGMKLARDTKRYADQLLALSPPMYDAYHTVGTLEYVVGSLPFFVRWFVRYDGIEGNRRKGIEALKLVARHGRYYGPFARILLSVVSLREKKFEDARQLLAGLVEEYPENALLRRELAQVTARLAAPMRRH